MVNTYTVSVVDDDGDVKDLTTVNSRLSALQVLMACAASDWVAQLVFHDNLTGDLRAIINLRDKTSAIYPRRG